MINGNVMNHRLIGNPPLVYCAELPFLVDCNGLQTVRVGALPPQLAEFNQTNVDEEVLTVGTALAEWREYVYQAALLDPHTGAKLDVDQIQVFRNELLDAHGVALSVYRYA